MIVCVTASAGTAISATNITTKKRGIAFKSEPSLGTPRAEDTMTVRA
jgi:hypothetical protein